MADIAKSTVGSESLCTPDPPPSTFVGGDLYAGENIGACDLVIFHTDGLLYRYTPTQPGPPVGFAPKAFAQGQVASIVVGRQRYNYGQGTLALGATYYASATVPGGISDTVPGSGWTSPVAVNYNQYIILSLV